MASYDIEMTFRPGTSNDPDTLRQLVDGVADAFARIGVTGHVGADLTVGRVDLRLTVDADSHTDAVGRAVAAARTAIHAAAWKTPGSDGRLGKLLAEEEFVLRSAPSALAATSDSAPEFTASQRN